MTAKCSWQKLLFHNWFETYNIGIFSIKYENTNTYMKMVLKRAGWQKTIHSGNEDSLTCANMGRNYQNEKFEICC